MKKVIGSLVLGMSLAFLLSGSCLAAKKAPSEKLYKTNISVKSLRSTNDGKVYYSGSVVNASGSTDLFLDHDDYRYGDWAHFPDLLKKGEFKPYTVEVPKQGESAPVIYKDFDGDMGCYYVFEQKDDSLLIKVKGLTYDSRCSMNGSDLVMEMY